MHRPTTQTTTPGVIEAIYTRRATRAYTSAPVDRSVIEYLIEAAIQAPSYTDNEPWSFAVVHGVDVLRGFSAEVKAAALALPLEHAMPERLRLELADPAFNVFHDAAALIIVCAISPRQQDAEDCCLAAENVMLAALAYGLGTCPIGLSRPWLQLPQSKAEIGIDAAHVPVFAIAIGHPAVPPPSPGRRKPRIIHYPA
jgi:nitroreductase